MTSSIDPRAFRNALGLFASGVAVIATSAGAEIHAMTASAVSSLSLEPPLVLFCPARASRFSQHLEAARTFSINFLREDQQALSSYFAGAWRETKMPPYRFVDFGGMPRLEGALTSLACTKERIVDGGDHLIAIGRVVAIHRGVLPLRPLLFFGGAYRAVSDEAGTTAPDLVAAHDEPPHVFYAD